MLEVPEVQIYLRSQTDCGKVSRLRSRISGRAHAKRWNGDRMSEQGMRLRAGGGRRNSGYRDIQLKTAAIRQRKFKEKNIRGANMAKKATAHDGQLMLQLYDLRREAEMRKARNWFQIEFWPLRSEER